jgi:hypothetical protein
MSEAPNAVRRAVEWLPDMDSNHDKVNQNHLCYHYTIGQKARSDVTGTGARWSSLEDGIQRPNSTPGRQTLKFSEEKELSGNNTPPPDIEKGLHWFGFRL